MDQYTCHSSSHGPGCLQKFNLTPQFLMPQDFVSATVKTKYLVVIMSADAPGQPGSRTHFSLRFLVVFFSPEFLGVGSRKDASLNSRMYH